MFKRIIYIFGTLVFLYGVIGFFILPLIIKSQAISYVKTNLNKELNIHTISFNPFVFKLSVHDVSLKEKEHTFFAFEKLLVDFELDRTLANKYLHFKTISLTKPYINAEINQDKQLNLLRLIPESSPKTETTQEKTKQELIKLQLDALHIEKAHIELNDYSHNEKFHASLNDINYTLRDLSTLKNSLAAQTFEAVLNEKTTLSLKGGLSLNPLKTYGNIEIANLLVHPFWNVIKESYPFVLDDNLTLHSKLGFVLNLENEPTIELNDASLVVENFHVRQKDQHTLLALNQLELSQLQAKFPYQANTKLLDTHFKLFINQGELLTHAQIDMEPFMAYVEFDLNKLPLTLLNPILSQNTFLEIQSAFLNTQGNLAFKANNLSLNANSSLEEVKINHHNTPLIKAKKVFANGIVFEQNQNLLLVKSVEALEPYAFVQINKKQELNLANLSKTQPKNTKEHQPTANPLLIKLGPLSIKNGQMTFEDLTLPIHFKINNHNINGSFSQFDSNSTKPTVVKLDGNIGQYGRMQIQGDLVHSDFKSFTDFKIDFDNIALNDLSGYSGKFVGRKIDEGKLSLDLSYYIEKSKLEAKNNLVISKIKLGDTIQSPEALNLPLELAIAILEDSNGIIDIKLPLKGNLDNPEFSVAPIVWQAFTNLIAKAITAPFSLLGSLFGFGEDEINSVPFYFGDSTITPVQKEPLDKIAEILNSRHKLAIKLNPTYDENNDLYALQTMAFKKQLQEALKKVNKEAYQKEYLNYLETQYNTYESKLSAFKAQYIKDKLLDERRYKEALENVLIPKQIIDPKTLETLAQQRTLNIQKYLMQQKVKKEQIIIENKVKTIQKKSEFTVIDLSLDNIK